MPSKGTIEVHLGLVQRAVFKGELLNRHTWEVDSKKNRDGRRRCGMSREGRTSHGHRTVWDSNGSAVMVPLK